MKKHYILAGVIFSLFIGSAYCAENQSVLKRIRSNDVNTRMNGFYDLVKRISQDQEEEYKGKYNCKFNISDIMLGKKTVIDLLKKEQKYETDHLVNGMYPPELGEGFGQYLADIGLFVDSCEDESAIDLFPGRRTINKYPKQTTEAVLSELDNQKKSTQYLYLVGLLGKLAPRYKQTNKKLYNKVKNRLIELIDDERASEIAVYSLKDLDDVDLMPVFEKISKYDDSKGAVGFYNGKKYISPISGIAKRALKKLKKRLAEQKKEKSLKKSTTGQIKK